MKTLEQYITLLKVIPYGLVDPNLGIRRDDLLALLEELRQWRKTQSRQLEHINRLQYVEAMSVLEKGGTPYAMSDVCTPKDSNIR